MRYTIVVAVLTTWALAGADAGSARTHRTEAENRPQAFLLMPFMIPGGVGDCSPKRAASSVTR